MNCKEYDYTNSPLFLPRTVRVAIQMMSLRKLNPAFMYLLAVATKYVLAKVTFVLSDKCVLLSLIGFFALSFY